jgi:hypothetical protein
LNQSVAFPTFFPIELIPNQQFLDYSSVGRGERSLPRIYIVFLHSQEQSPSNGWISLRESAGFSSERNYTFVSKSPKFYFFQSDSQIQFQKVGDFFLFGVVDQILKIVLIAVLLVPLLVAHFQ